MEQKNKKRTASITHRTKSFREHKPAEKTLFASEDRLKTLTNAAFEGIAITEKGVMLEINNQLAEMVGYTREELLGKPVASLVAPADLERVGKAIHEGNMQVYQHKCVRKDGTEFPVEVRGRTLQARGRNIRITAIRDISDQQRVEQALRESEELFRTFMDYLPSMAIIKDDSLRPLYFNKKFNEYFPGDQWLGKTPQETFSPEVAKTMVEADLLAIKKRSVVYEEEWTDANGMPRTLETRKFLIERQGKPPHLGAIITDITERKKATDALAAEKERLSVTLRSIGDAVIATNVSGRIALMNKVAEQLTGWTLAEAEGRELAEVFFIVDGLTRERCNNPVEEVLKTGDIVSLANHTVLVSRDNQEYVIADCGAPIRDKTGKTIGVVLVFRDNTEKQKTQDAMINAQRIESLGILAGGIAHDFNNLLSGMFGYLDLAQGAAQNNDKTREYIEKAFSVFGRAKDLTGQLLTFSKGGAPARKSKEIASLVRNAVHFALSGSAIKSQFEIDQNLRQCDVDENQIGQVLDNIVINARDAMPMGGAITVTVENVSKDSPLPYELKQGDYVRISITDQGTGIAPEHLPHIFDPFFTTKQKGSGLGLATSYSIVKRHDGLIEAQSVLGKGSTFFIYLPASKGDGAKDVTAMAIAAHKGTGTVLVMDDEDFIRDVADAMLSSMGYTVETAVHGSEAVEKFTKAQESGKPFDLAILDLTIPGGMGGMETKEALRKISPHLKVLASSGYSEDPIMANPGSYGFDGAVGKPYNKAELGEAAEKIMGRKQ
jgi:PAS domain S-box-containing protein